MVDTVVFLKVLIALSGCIIIISIMNMTVHATSIPLINGELMPVSCRNRRMELNIMTAIITVSFKNKALKRFICKFGFVIY